MADRVSIIKRETREKNIHLESGIDGSGSYEVVTGVRSVNRLLSSAARPG